jgi:hypothetical protein
VSSYRRRQAVPQQWIFRHICLLNQRRMNACWHGLRTMPNPKAEAVFQIEHLLLKSGPVPQNDHGVIPSSRKRD